MTEGGSRSAPLGLPPLPERVATMAKLSFRDRFFTPKVAEAMMSPGGIVLAGVGAAVTILAGAPLIAAAGVGALAWGGRVLAAVGQEPAQPRSRTP